MVHNNYFPSWWQFLHQCLMNQHTYFVMTWYELLWLNLMRPSDAYICIHTLTTIGSDNGLSPGQCQAIIWTSARILLIGPLGINFSGILIRIQTFSYTKIHLKMPSAKWRPFCLGLNVLTRMRGYLDNSPTSGHQVSDYTSYSCFVVRHWFRGQYKDAILPA